MTEASQAYVRIEDLQVAAGDVIARVTGAAAGYVTSGAAAGLLLGTAACVAGDDATLMEAMPDLSAVTRNEVIVQRAHRNSYDHAVRGTGVRLVEIGGVGHPTPVPTRPFDLDRAIGPRTAAVLWVEMGDPEALGVLTLPETAAIAAKHGVPVIVDAAASLPPPSNLRRFIDEGASLVCFSGGKAIGGPQASGVLAGRADLIRSVALQHQDMDVHPETWTWRHLIADGTLDGPPLQGIGRACKVGREEVAGLVVALERFVARDHAAELRARQAMASTIAEGLVHGLTDNAAVRVEAHDGAMSWRPSVTLAFDGSTRRAQAIGVTNRLASGDPSVAVGQGGLDRGTISLSTACLEEAEVASLVSAVLRAMADELSTH
jgi:L-seryl-tRNA(Ser) seleniumtransferase